MIAELLAEHDVPPRFLEVEITETALVADPSRILPVLTRNRADGRSRLDRRLRDRHGPRSPAAQPARSPSSRSIGCSSRTSRPARTKPGSEVVVKAMSTSRTRSSGRHRGGGRGLGHRRPARCARRRPGPGLPVLQGGAANQGGRRASRPACRPDDGARAVPRRSPRLALPCSTPFPPTTCRMTSA